MVFDSSKTGGSPHNFLAQLVGGWLGTTQTWPEPEGTPSESRTQGSIQLILEGRFAIYLYQNTLRDEVQHGMFTFGYNTVQNQYEASWVDSFHNNTAIMFCVGMAIENGFSILGSYPDPTGGPDWGWRTEVVLEDPNHLTITAFNISPEGSEAKATEVRLVRAKG